MKKLLILGATGSIGTTCLNSIRKENPGIIVCGMTARQNADKLNSLGKEFSCPTLLTGQDIENCNLEEFIQKSNPDIVLNAIAGSDGLYASVVCIRNGKNIALANKETVVMGGRFIFDYAKAHNVRLIPVDSEHSAIYHLLQGHAAQSLVITASGGPFLNRKDTSQVTLEEALNHPTWKMGRKITIDSATLANKGLEVIEASFLFNFKPEDIEVTIHRQSVVHSMIRTQEGSVYAQMSPPDMALPIMAAVSDKELSLHDVVRPLSFKDLTLTFQAPDFDQFPMLKHAYRVLEIGGSAPIAFNASDEVAVQAFIDGKISFDHIQEVVGTTIENVLFQTESHSFEEIKKMDAEARRIARGLL